MIIAAREESLENWPLVLKCFCLGVTHIISTNLLLAKACHEGTYIPSVIWEREENCKHWPAAAPYPRT